MNIVCIGAGVMASSFALSQRSHQVTIVASEFDASVVSSILSTGKDDRLEAQWDPSIRLIEEEAIGSLAADIIVFGVSSVGLNWAKAVAQKILTNSAKPIPVVLLTKGLIIEGSSVSLLSDDVAQHLSTDVFSITGPCIAKELAHHKPTKVNLSGKNSQLLEEIASLISQPNYSVIPTHDYIGCQWAAALKNVYAIAVAEAGDDQNLRSTRFAEAVSEMANWLESVGGEAQTAYGLSGLGDLYVTCLGGRNGKLGHYLSQGMSTDDIMSGPLKGVTVEGLELAKSLQETQGALKAKMYQALLKVLI
ncbi:MAG: NAD(P)H-dependent glycerol-3-phosphate dehydrogenase [Pseudomonadota bacterium]|nr:NAD(P)H-dependent glycerol-3-phosphate dehydrogenase [Pseudomonadota bacterium]